MKNKTINGKEEGLWESYHSNGELSQKGNCINNKLEGLWEYYYYNGQLKYKYIIYVASFSTNGIFVVSLTCTFGIRMNSE